MNTHKQLLLTAVSALFIAHAQAQTQAPGTAGRSYSGNNAPMTTATGATGSILRKDIRWDSKIPLNATYSQLNDEQKAELHSQYEKLEPGDEPPFPVDGIKPIFSAIRKAQRTLQARGELDMVVNVDAQGNATSVEDRGHVQNQQMTELAQQVLLLTKFKPAVCKGQPCVMQYRFTQKLSAG